MSAADPHDELVAALRSSGNPRLGARVAEDRGSELDYLGVRMPALRGIARGPLTFTDAPADEVLTTWDRLWHETPYGEVLFAALEYYLPIARRDAGPDLWPVINRWVDRVDNWAHADALSNLYSHVLHHHHDEVYPTLREWNGAEEQWLRRISLVSLIHYSGKNAVFLPPDQMLPLVATCLHDQREYIQKAVGWVLRELTLAHPEAGAGFLEEHLNNLGSIAFARAVERHSPEDRSALRDRRKQQPR